MQLEEQRLQQEAQDLQMRQEKHQLDKLKMIMQAQDMQSKVKTNHLDRSTEMHKAELDYSAQIAKIVGDLHKTHIQTSAKSKSAD